jgi:hypothetical protein
VRELIGLTLALCLCICGSGFAASVGGGQIYCSPDGRGGPNTGGCGTNPPFYSTGASQLPASHGVDVAVNLTGTFNFVATFPHGIYLWGDAEPLSEFPSLIHGVGGADFFLQWFGDSSGTFPLLKLSATSSELTFLLSGDTYIAALPAAEFSATYSYEDALRYGLVGSGEPGMGGGGGGLFSMTIGSKYVDFSNDKGYFWTTLSGEFAITEVLPAPVPVPAAMALLVAGIPCLMSIGMLSRRIRRVGVEHS